MAWMRSIFACLTALILVGSLSVPEASGAPCDGVRAGLSWTTIEGPSFSSGAPTISDHAIAPRRPNRIYVTNGSTVVLTEDGGCSWNEVFSLRDLPDLDMPVSKLTGARIESLSVPEEASAQSEMVMVVTETIGPATRPHVISTSDAGRTWDLRDNGLPLVSGNVYQLNIAPSDARTMYLLMQGSPATGTVLWVTQDGGASWQERGEIPGAIGLRVDPIQPRSLWFYGGALLFSGDGGSTFSEIKYAAPPVAMVDVFHAPGAPSRVLAYQVEGGFFTRTTDGGKTWTPINTPPNTPLSIAHGNEQEEIIMSVHQGVYRFQAPSHWVEVTPGLQQGVRLPQDYEDVADLQVPRVDAPAPVGRTSDTLERYTGFQIALPPLTPSAPPVKADASLIGPDHKIKIEAGASKKVDYRLKLPPQPTPLDVFFLVDTTQSMESSINGLLAGLRSIAESLSNADVDARFGAGEYKDYPFGGWGDPLSGDFPYRRNRDMGPADESLVDSLEMMQASGGGTHQPESQLTALYQAATGTGEPGCAGDVPGGPQDGPGANRLCVPPGQQATFRGEALRVIMNITDAGFEDSPAHPSPPFEVVAKTLSDAGILQVGLAVFGPNGNDPALDWLGRMATATGTIVPPGGVDCDGDGVKELGADAPLVCEIDEETRAGVAKLAPAILATLRAITDIADVSLVARSGDALVKDISPTFEGVDVKDPQTLDFTVTFECPEQRLRSSVELVGTVRDASVAGTTTRVVCAPSKEEEAEEVLPPIVELIQPPFAALAIAPPAPPPPAPVTQYQPQPNANVQAAMAQQEQEEAELAFAGQVKEEEAEEAYLMTSYERRPRGVGAEAIGLYLVATAMAGLAAAVRLRTRHRIATQQQRGRRL